MQTTELQLHLGYNAFYWHHVLFGLDLNSQAQRGNGACFGSIDCHACLMSFQIAMDESFCKCGRVLAVMLGYGSD